MTSLAPPWEAVGFFRRKVRPSIETAKPKPFRIELGWRGMFGLAAVCFCLLMWMFLLGIWAGQTILLPPRPMQTAREGASPTQFQSGSGAEDGSRNQQPRPPAP